MRLLCLLVSLLILMSGPAWSQKNDSPLERGGLLPFPTGLRVGHTSWDGISQIHFGAHAKLGEVFPSFHFTPGIEAGFGDNATVITFNGDLAYSFTELSSFPWGFYGGGSLSLNYLNLDLGPAENIPGVDSDDWQLGLSALAGVTRARDNGDEWMLEARISLLDSPEFKLTLGYTFF
jgi:hypothetical protein